MEWIPEERIFRGRPTVSWCQSIYEWIFNCAQTCIWDLQLYVNSKSWQSSGILHIQEVYAFSVSNMYHDKFISFLKLNIMQFYITSHDVTLIPWESSFFVCINNDYNNFHLPVIPINTFFSIVRDYLSTILVYPSYIIKIKFSSTNKVKTENIWILHKVCWKLES